MPQAANPLTEAIFYILLSLTDGKKHGYAIMKDIRYLSEGEVQLSTSTLYNALNRMEEQGLINRANESDDDKGNPVCRVRPIS